MFKSCDNICDGVIMPNTKLKPNNVQCSLCYKRMTFSSRSLCSSVYPLFTLSLLSLYFCLFALLSVLDFIFSYDSSSFITCLLSFHMLLTFYHMCTIFHMLTVITCLPFITCYLIYLDYKIPAVICRT